MLESTCWDLGEIFSKWGDEATTGGFPELISNQNLPKLVWALNFSDEPYSKQKSAELPNMVRYMHSIAWLDSFSDRAHTGLYLLHVQSRGYALLKLVDS